MDKKKPLYFKYLFILNSGTKLSFNIELDPYSLRYIPKEEPETAPWTKLEHHQCKDCPLKRETHPECPLAINLSSVIPVFSDLQSFERANIIVETAERTYTKNTTLQNGLSSMLGIFMVTSDCPVMSVLRPMVRFHLPFASVEETIFRSASTYLLKQYFKNKRDNTADWDLSQLNDEYKRIQDVNIGMSKRMRSIASKDANLNALVILDVFAKEMPFSIEKGMKDLEYLFS